MDPKGASSALETLISSFAIRIAELQDLAVARNMDPAAATVDLAEVDANVTALEQQVEAIKRRVEEELSVIPKAKKLIELSQRQERKIQHMIAHIPPQMYKHRSQSFATPSVSTSSRFLQEFSQCGTPSLPSKFNVREISPMVGLNFHSEFEEKEAPRPIQERKGHARAPRWYITAQELESLSSYMRGRLTLDKLNIAVNEIAGYADANALLIANPKKKELRDIAVLENLKGKYFFLETDIKGPGLKLDKTGKTTLVVLRHLGRIQEQRIGPHHVYILSMP